MADTTSTMTTEHNRCPLMPPPVERADKSGVDDGKGVGEGDAVASFPCQFDFRGETEAEFGCGGGVGAEIAGESG